MSRPVDVGSLRVGGYMLIDNEPCHIVDITKSKPGKHGSAKARIVAIGVFDGQKRQFVKPVDSNTEIPIIDKRPGQVFAVNPTGVQIMDLETYNLVYFSLETQELIEVIKYVKSEANVVPDNFYNYDLINDWINKWFSSTYF